METSKLREELSHHLGMYADARNASDLERMRSELDAVINIAEADKAAAVREALQMVHGRHRIDCARCYDELALTPAAPNVNKTAKTFDIASADVNETAAPAVCQMCGGSGRVDFPLSDGRTTHSICPDCRGCGHADHGTGTKAQEVNRG